MIQLRRIDLGNRFYSRHQIIENCGHTPTVRNGCHTVRRSTRDFATVDPWDERIAAGYDATSPEMFAEARSSGPDRRLPGGLRR
jgi:hypothetical protein